MESVTNETFKLNIRGQTTACITMIKEKAAWSVADYTAGHSCHCSGMSFHLPMYIRGIICRCAWGGWSQTTQIISASADHLDPLTLNIIFFCECVCECTFYEEETVVVNRLYISNQTIMHSGKCQLWLNCVFRTRIFAVEASSHMFNILYFCA